MTILTLLRGRLRRRTRDLRGDDRGVAMITVLGVTMTVTALVVATLAFTVNGVRSARWDQDWQSSLSAAEAGVDHYLSRINEDGTYWQYGNPAAPYTATSGSNVALPTGSKVNPAFSGWTEVPGSAGRAHFRYAVDTSAFKTSGIIKLQSTGRVGQRTRTVESSVGRRNFIDYLYFTEYEIKDPDSYVQSSGGDSYTPSEAQTLCNRHLYTQVGGAYRRDRVNSDISSITGGSTSAAGCSMINFGSVDTINGPFHTNDAIYVCGQPTFSSEATTSYNGSLTSGRRYVRNSACSTNTPLVPANGNNLAYQPPLNLPPSNAALKRQVDPTFTNPNPPGCLYTGPTQITFNSNGTMTVVSPWTRNGGAAFCGTGTVAIPSRGVIWVQNVPTPADAYTRTQTEMMANRVAGSQCTATFNPLNHPRAWTSGGRVDMTPYSCFAGDAFVSGSVRGAVTVGAENNIVVTDDLRYATASCSTSSSCNDVVGLVANNYVEVMHPVGCNSSGGDCQSLTNQQVDLVVEAAILSVGHSFRVQHAGLGSVRGTLTVRGAIGQRYRGPVGALSGTSIVRGYAKNYVYDWRLRYASPPYFLDPVQSSYGQKTWAEPRAAYAWNAT